MMTLESILTNFLTSYMQDCFFAMPAVVVSVRNLEQLSLDVQPLPNRNFKDGDSAEYPVLYHVPAIMPYTGSSALLMPVQAGDTVMLVFSQRGIDEFKSGSDIAYDTGNRYMSIQDAVAIIGISPFSKSPNQKIKHILPHDPNDLTLVHNIGLPNECEVRLKQDGSVEITSTKEIKLNSPVVKINGVNFSNHRHGYPRPTPAGLDFSSTNIVSLV